MQSKTAAVKVPDPFLAARLRKLAKAKGIEVGELVEKIFRKKCK